MNPFIENECEICEAYENFIGLLNIGVPTQEAFHFIVDGLLDEVSEQAYGIGQKRGYAEAFENLSDVLGVFSEVIHKEVDEELED